MQEKNMVTNSIIVFKEEDFHRMAEAIGEYEAEMGLEDIALLEEYSNIIMDCAEENADALMKIIREKHSDLYWRWMESNGDLILKITVYDENGIVSERIDKSMDDIALESTYQCSGNCSECSGDCEHGDGCNCGECSREKFSLEQSVEMINELAFNGEGEEFYSTLVKAFLEELKAFTEAQTEGNEEAEEVYDLFLHMLTQIVLIAASRDGNYTLREHDCIEEITGEMDFDRTKAALPNITPDDESMICAMKYWHDAEGFGCDVRRLVLMMCVYLCSTDAPVNDTEMKFLEMLASA